MLWLKLWSWVSLQSMGSIQFLSVTLLPCRSSIRNYYASQIISIAKCSPSQRAPIEPVTFKVHLQTLPYHRQPLLHGVRKIASDAKICTAFRNRKQLVIVSDGSLKDSYVTYCWKLVTPELPMLFEGSGPVNGPTTQSSSAQAELFGLGSPLSYIQEYSEYNSAPIWGKIKWLCNSKTALARVEKTIWQGSQRRSQPNNMDIVLMIADEIKILRQPFQSWWVKDHQDDEQCYINLLSLAKINVMWTNWLSLSTLSHSLSDSSTNVIHILHIHAHVHTP